MSQLSPSPKFAVTYVNASGYTVPAVGYKLYTYTAGTSTPKATYTDYTLGSSNTNPVVMDARGECDLWLSGNYKLVLKTDADVTVWTVDEVRDLTSSQTLTNMTLAGTLTVTSTAVTWSGNPTHSGNHTWTGNQVFNGNVTIGDSAADTLTITPNAVTWSNNPTHSGNHTFSGSIVLGDASSDTTTINATTTFPLAVSTHTFGIKVGNTARADTSTLDWYEEGSSTISIEGTAVAGTANYSSRTMVWQRFGNWLSFTAQISWTTFTGTGSIKFTGAPYAAADAVTPIIITSDSLTYTDTLTAYVSSAGTGTIILETMSSASARSALAVDVFGAVYLSGRYRCA
jgi:hypothetical protein